MVIRPILWAQLAVTGYSISPMEEQDD